jgi:hypothetical protein
VAVFMVLVGVYGTALLSETSNHGNVFFHAFSYKKQLEQVSCIVSKENKIHVK